MADGVLGTALQSYQPLNRMHEKAAQLRAELDTASKADRHAQFKRGSSKSLLSFNGGGQGTPSPAPGASPPRRFLRTTTSVHSVSTVIPGSSGTYERPTSASLFASRLSSRRVSNTSGGATDLSGDEVRTTTSGGKSSPSRRLSRPTRVSVARDLPDYAAAISRQNQLEDTVAELEDQVRQLASDNERRQDSYMRREAALQEEMAKLQEQLRKARGDQPQNPVFGKAAANIRDLHNQVVSQVEDLLTAQAATFRNEEHGTLRNFTARLNELEAAVMAEKAKGAAREDIDCAEQIKVLRAQLDSTQQIAQILDKKHSVVAEENSRLRAQFKLQEEDREYLIKQTVALKKENGALRNQLATLLEEISVLNQEKEDLVAATTAASASAGFTSTEGGGGGGGGILLTLGGGGGRPSSAAVATRPGSSRGGGGGGAAGTAGGPESQIAVKIQRYEDVIDSLKRLLEAERRRTKQARAAHTLELQQRTGLQALLRQCVEDIRERRKALEAEAQRERSASDRDQARNRPISALRPVPAASAVARPLSAAPSALTPTNRRPNSAAGMAAHGPFAGVAGTAAASAANDVPLTPSERQDLISTLLSHEDVMRAVFDRAFPGVTPHPPSDPYLDRMAAWQEQRDAQVAANAKVLAAAKNAVLPPATAIKESTPGGMLLKEAANRPWVLNVDAMLSDFLGGGGGGGGGGGMATAAPSTKSLGGLSGISGGGAGP